jgi:uncharacterized protein (DUF488 family)
VWTVGHSTHHIDVLLELLAGQGITAVADVRSSPFSRLAPQFNRENLAASLRAVGIQYVFLGQQLGARPQDPGCYVEGRVQYSRLAELPTFHAGIERVLGGAQRFRLALMCAEKDPLDCHRTILIARELVARGVVVKHILADGSIEDHEFSMLRLLDSLRLPRQDLFRSFQQIVADGLARQEARIAFVEEGPEADQGRSST